MAKVIITVADDKVVYTTKCDQKEIYFTHQENGDGIITFPNKNHFLEVVVNKENIK